jgi:hypothetical protein
MLHVEPCSAQNVDEQNQPSNRYESPQPSVEELQKKSNQRADKKENNEAVKDGLVRKFFQFVREYNAEIVAISTVVMAIFTIALTWSTYLLWKSGEKHSERELRAYLGIAEGDIQQHVDPAKGRLKAQMVIRNTGQTPAYNVRLIASFDFHKIPRTEFAAYGIGKIQQSNATIDPGVEVIVPLVAEKLVSEENFKAVREGRFAFFFYGRIEYRDTFRKERFRNFRWIADNDDTGSLAWRVCEEGNEST